MPQRRIVAPEAQNITENQQGKESGVSSHRKPSSVRLVNAYVPMQLPQLLCAPAVTDGFFRVTFRMTIDVPVLHTCSGQH